MLDLWKMFLAQTTGGAISLLASSFIAGGILKSDGGGLASTYRRIIFGISISDILQSLAMTFGPLAVPSGSLNGLWAKGNDQSCQTIGYVYQFSMISTLMYMFSLCLFSVLRIKKPDISDLRFFRFEMIGHLFIILTSIIITTLGLATKSINPGVGGNVCGFALKPTGCRQRPDLFGECIESMVKYVDILVYFSNIVLPISCLLGIVGCMGTVCMHSLGRSIAFGTYPTGGGCHMLCRCFFRKIKENHYQSEEQCSGQQMTSFHTGDLDQEGGENTGSSNAKEAALKLKRLAEETSDQQHNENSNSSSMILARIYQKEIIIQACCFVLALIVTHISMWIVNFYLLFSQRPPDFFIAATFVLLPLGGFFNVLVYTRYEILLLLILRAFFSENLLPKLFVSYDCS